MQDMHPPPPQFINGDKDGGTELSEVWGGMPEIVLNL